MSIAVEQFHYLDSMYWIKANDNATYNVIHNGSKIGEFYPEVEGEYVFKKQGDWYMSHHVLRVICDLLEWVNKVHKYSQYRKIGGGNS